MASLASPNMAPRGNRSSILRSGTAPTLVAGKKDYAAQALINKANEKEERDRRRKSVALPASLSAPSIVSRFLWLLLTVGTAKQQVIRIEEWRTGATVISSARSYLSRKRRPSVKGRYQRSQSRPG